uniref:Uncharacterized protein n=1 Tax=Avena sativa TaxID=4498 RepID=A0ACD5XKF6_AVESA
MEFLLSVEQAQQTEWNSGRAHCPIAWDNYLHWFLENTRVSICPPSYEEEILEEPCVFDEIAYNEYNKLVREGHEIPISSSLKFARKEIKKHADETEDILHDWPKGKKAEGILKNFLKRTAKKMHRLSNLLGCRDPEYTTPSNSRSKSISDPTANLEDDEEEEATTVARTEDEMPRMENEMEEDYQIRSAYLLKPRREFTRWTPEDFRNKGKANVVEHEPPRRSRASRRMRGLDYDDDEEEEEEAEEEEAAVTQKMALRRGRRPRTRGRK